MLEQQFALDRAYNTPATDYRRIAVAPLSGACGAEIRGVDLAGTLDDATVAEVRRALLDHLVVFFREQALTPARLAALARRFGELHVHPFAEGMAEHPEILVVRKAKTDRFNFGGEWHADVTWSETPPLGSILYAERVPAWGGDTLFANQYMAYDALSEGMQRMLSGLRAVHSAARVYAPTGYYAADEYQRMGGTQVRPSEQARREYVHPVVRTHPETGRRCLFVNASYTERFEGMTREESRPLLEYLFEHAVRAAFTCRFRWQTGSVAFWDNRCVLHNAINDYPGEERLLYRATVIGERPA
ncbi:MAG: TauD/TfdA family dioxygenase [Burkholderiales bacterium]|nr:TauD/TfdA family dioxygenase [Burkholderiales bacterium]